MKKQSSKTKSTREAPRAIIAASILAGNHGALADEVRSLERAGTDWIHVDVMDGSFVPPITFGATTVAALRKVTKLSLDVHLMIVRPEEHIKAFAEAGADRIIVHAEATSHLHRLVQAIRALGISAGVAVNPATPIGPILEVLDLIDLALIMTVNPGWGGQSFIASSLTKIEQLSHEIQGRNLAVHLEVDGGINPETARRCRAAGATVFVAGTSICAAKNRSAAVAALR